MKLTPRDLLFSTLLLAAATALRVYGLGMHGLWYDEVFSAEIAQLPALDLIVRTANDVHPPLYYLLLRFWNLATQSEADGTMRLLSALLDLGGIGATAYLAWVTFRSRLAVWVAASLHAFSPYAIVYAQELRMYSLLLLCSTLSIAGVLLLAERASTGRIVGYVLSTLAALYTHIFAVFLVAAQTAWFLFSRREPPGLGRRGWVLLQVGVGLAYSPWAWVITKQMLWAEGYRARGDWWIPKPPLKALVGVIHVLLGSDWVLLGLGGGLLSFLAVWLVTRRVAPPELPARLWGFATIVALPLLVAFVVSHVTTPVFVARFFTEVLPALWMLLLAAVLALPSRAVRVAALLGLGLASARAIPAINYGNAFKAPTPYREIVAFLAEQPPGVVLTPPSASTEFAWRWYTRDATSVPGWLRSRRLLESSPTPVEGVAPGSSLYVVWTQAAEPPAELPLEGAQRATHQATHAFKAFRLVVYTREVGEPIAR